MTDVHDKATQSYIMSRIKVKNTKPEMLVRKFLFANEADLLNVALFGKTARQWRNENQGVVGNIRDQAAIEQLVVLSNLESINSVFIRQGLSQSERLVQLNKIAITQMTSLVHSRQMKKLI